MGPRATVMVVIACALAAFVGFGHGIAIAAVKLPPVTISQYEHSTTPATLDAQGCNAGKGRKTGLVILDFGRPAFKNGAYGTLDFAGNFQWNVPINKAVEAYMIGYMRCRPAGLKGMLVGRARHQQLLLQRGPALLPQQMWPRAAVVHQGRVLVGMAYQPG